MNTRAVLFSTALSLASAGAATVQINQTVEVTGAGWLAGAYAGGTISFTGVGGTPFNTTFSVSGNSAATVDGTGFGMIAVAGAASSIMSGITGLRNTADFKDRVAWIEIDVVDFDVADGNLTTFFGSTASGVYVPASNGLVFTADGGGLVAFSNPVTSGVAGGTGTLRFVTDPGVTFGGLPQATTTMFWNPGVIGNDLHVSAVRYGIETLQTVPEPSAALLGGLGLLGLLRRRK